MKRGTDGTESEIKMNHIVVIGFMGSGKTRVGKRLAKDLHLSFVDLDKAITTKVKMSVSEIFKRFGEPFYRAMETFAVKELMEDTQQKVISLGAAFPVQEQNEIYMKSLGTVVYLKASPEVILERLESTQDERLKKGEVSEEKIRKMLHCRAPVYEKQADIVAVTGVKSFDDLIAEIEEKLHHREVRL